MGFFGKYSTGHDAKAESASQDLRPNRKGVLRAVLVLLLTATVLVWFNASRQSEKEKGWYPAEATARTELMYFSTQLDRITGRQIPDARGGRECVVITFRKADGTECSSLTWDGQLKKEFIESESGTVSILYHEDWHGTYFESQSAAEVYFGNRPGAFSGGWVASTGEYLAESQDWKQPKLDEAIFRTDSLVLTRHDLQKQLTLFAILSLFIPVAVYWTIRRSIARRAKKAGSQEEPTSTPPPQTP